MEVDFYALNLEISAILVNFVARFTHYIDVIGYGKAHYTLATEG